MKQLKFILILYLVVGSSVTFGNNSTKELLSENEIRLSEAADSSLTEGPIRVIVDIRKKVQVTRLNKELFSSMIIQSLKRKGIRALVHRGDFSTSFKAKSLKAWELLTPKIVLDVTITKGSTDHGYTVHSCLTYIKYKPTSDRKTAFSPNVWTKEKHTTSVSKNEIHSLLDRFIDKELKNLPVPHTASRYKYRKGIKKSHGMGKLSYSLKFNDTENKANNILIGATMGTPHIFNLHLGFWGSRSLPLVAGLSGMFFTYEYRAVQFDFGWAFDNTGNTKQAIGIVLAGYNETTPFYLETKDVIGRVTDTDTGNNYVLKLYMGPVYTLDWNNIRLQLGPVIKTPMDGNQDIKYLLQIGYTIPIRL